MERVTEYICNNCGGDLQPESGSLFVCSHCGAKQQLLTEELNIQSQNAFDKLRRGSFEDAEEAFSDIISTNPDCAEAYWGRALARNGIIFVDDLVENKKVPTCMCIKEASFMTDSDYLIALNKARFQVSERYRDLAEKIEKIRVEWLDKARKEAGYDIFICYKESSDGKRTDDSYEAQSLYTHLMEKGYRVFFARESLRSKISEQFEPYIYNALRTAKVMIVYGQNAEYFNSVWVKNEWARFISLIGEGLKQASSLVVAYEKITPEQLPRQLRARQCIDASRKTFLYDLDTHIERVIAASLPDLGRVDRIKIARTPAKKPQPVASIPLKDIGIRIPEDVIMAEERREVIIKRYISDGMKDRAKEFVRQELAKTPKSGKLKYYKLLLDLGITNGYGLATLKSFKEFAQLESVIADSDKETAGQLLINCFLLASNLIKTSPRDSLTLVGMILPYDFAMRDKCIAKLITSASAVGNEFFVRIIEKILIADPARAIETLISAGDAALAASNFSGAFVCYDKATSLDGTCTDAFRGIMRAKCRQKLSARRVEYDSGSTLLGVKSDFENVLKTLSGRRFMIEVRSALDSIVADSVDISAMTQTFNHYIKYYPGELSEIADIISLASAKCSRTRHFKDVLYYQSLLLSIDSKNPVYYWNVILAKTSSQKTSDILSSNTPIDTLEEYSALLALASDKDVQTCISLANRQRKAISAREEKVKKEEASRRRKTRSCIFGALALAATVIGVVILTLVLM